ncbi:30563_t:CDS:2, partial [Racocetra persica]
MLLRKSKHLKCISLYNTVHDQIVKTIAEILYTNTAIKTLNIGLDNLCSNEGKKLVQAIYKNNALESLRLSDDQLGIGKGRANQVKFDFTEQCPSVTYSKHKLHNGSYMNIVYLTGSLPTSSTSTEAVIPKCEKIEITCESHDQGWSSYPQDRGAYNNSWTWGEISIVIPELNNDVQGQSINYKVVEKEPKTRYLVYTNKHADDNWQTHNCEFLSDHPLVQSLQPGDFVGLWIRSEFP